MGLFDTIMNLVYEEESQSLKKTPSTAKTVTTPPAQPKIKPPQKQLSKVKTTPLPTEPKVQIDQDVDKEFARSLKTAIDAHNLPGFDLYEFYIIVKQAVANGKSEPDALNEALAASKTMRVSKTSLLDNYNHYKDILLEQKENFEKELNIFYDDNIKLPKEEEERINREIQDKLAQIKQLETEIENLKEQRKAIDINSEAAENQMAQVRTAFDKAYNEAASQLKGIVEALKKT